jgi:hypothetical protein
VRLAQAPRPAAPVVSGRNVVGTSELRADAGCLSDVRVRRGRAEVGWTFLASAGIPVTFSGVEQFDFRADGLTEATLAWWRLVDVAAHLWSGRHPRRTGQRATAPSPAVAIGQ